MSHFFHSSISIVPSKSTYILLCPHLKFSFFFIFVHIIRVHIYQSAFIIFFLFVSQILFIWLITSVSYCHLDLLIDFLSILFVDLAIHFLSRSLCHFDLLYSFSDNFIYCLLLLIKGILLILSSIIIIT
jgi:hypothetical protein